jgi:hypothetical protein
MPRRRDSPGILLTRLGPIAIEQVCEFDLGTPAALEG